MEEIHLTAKDFKLEWYSGTGAGGQHRNKHQNCCRITHIETGISAVGTRSRERASNQREAFNTLAKRIISFYSIPKERRESVERIRNYHEVRNEVLDYASGRKMSYKDAVLSGDMSELIDARRMAKIAENEK